MATFHHILCNGRPLCEAPFHIREKAHGCDFRTRHATETEAKRLRKLFPKTLFKVRQGTCPVYDTEIEDVLKDFPG